MVSFVSTFCKDGRGNFQFELTVVNRKLISVNSIHISLFPAYVCIMQKKIRYVLVSMAICVLGITGLQLYWNYQNYRTIIANFKKDADAALSQAVDQERFQRRMAIVDTFKKWMADTTIMKISCDTLNREHETRFTMTDVVPYYPDEKADRLTIGINAFKEKLGKITPAAKQFFINHFAKIVEDDLRDGTTYYYTQGMGHRLEKAFDSSKMNENRLAILFKKELEKKNISSNFNLITKTNQEPTGFLTHEVNTAFRRPYDKEMVKASLENPNSYYVREMKWLIVSSALLIGITFCCFYYTVKTLFSQYQLVAIKNQFISNMTHEINTPLASIQVTTEALQQFDHDATTRKKYLDIIHYQTLKLNDLTSEILENAKLETLEFPRDEDVNLNQVVLSVINEFKNKEKLAVRFNLPEEKMMIKGNKQHLTRSVANIVENAIKYNLSENPIIEISLSRLANQVCLSVKDNGPGIANEYKEKIFDQFYRVPTGDVHNIKGYGLGLSYVKKVISQHKGHISVDDNFPAGTSFSINLPS